ncbi:2024_t:CDS:2, partial [Scutellospora calospora]
NVATDDDGFEFTFCLIRMLIIRFNEVMSLTGFIVFIFFGTGQNALSTYRMWGRKIHLDSFFSCFKERPEDFQINSTFHAPKSPHSFNSHQYSNSLGDIKIIIPDQNKGNNNLLFLNGHRIPSEWLNVIYQV